MDNIDYLFEISLIKKKKSKILILIYFYIRFILVSNYLILVCLLWFLSQCKQTTNLYLTSGNTDYLATRFVFCHHGHSIFQRLPDQSFQLLNAGRVVYCSQHVMHELQVEERFPQYGQNFVHVLFTHDCKVKGCPVRQHRGVDFVHGFRHYWNGIFIKMVLFLSIYRCNNCICLIIEFHLFYLEFSK